MSFDSTEKTRLAQGAKQFGLELNDRVLDQFMLFAERLEETNRTLNLTRIAPEDYVPLHFLDSLAIASFWKPKPGNTLLDLGTGAGFPGLPLAMVYPELNVTLMDGTLKRLRFLDGVIAELGLTNVKTLHARAEKLQGKAAFDVVTARAIARLPKLLDWMLPLVKRGGLAMAFKGQDIAEELREAHETLKRYRVKVERVSEITLPETEVTRKIVLIR